MVIRTSAFGMLYAVIYLTELRQSVVRDTARPIVRAIDGPRHPSGFELELSSWRSKRNDSSVCVWKSAGMLK